VEFWEESDPVGVIRVCRLIVTVSGIKLILHVVFVSAL